MHLVTNLRKSWHHPTRLGFHLGFWTAATHEMFSVV
jgi:hypothetical protein